MSLMSRLARRLGMGGTADLPIATPMQFSPGLSPGLCRCGAETELVVPGVVVCPACECIWIGSGESWRRTVMSSHVRLVAEVRRLRGIV